MELAHRVHSSIAIINMIAPLASFLFFVTAYSMLLLAILLKPGRLFTNCPYIVLLKTEAICHRQMEVPVNRRPFCGPI